MTAHPQRSTKKTEQPLGRRWPRRTATTTTTSVPSPSGLRTAGESSQAFCSSDVQLITGPVHPQVWRRPSSPQQAQFKTRQTRPSFSQTLGGRRSQSGTSKGNGRNQLRTSSRTLRRQRQFISVLFHSFFDSRPTCSPHFPQLSLSVCVHRKQSLFVISVLFTQPEHLAL